MLHCAAADAFVEAPPGVQRLGAPDPDAGRDPDERRREVFEHEDGVERT